MLFSRLRNVVLWLIIRLVRIRGGSAPFAAQ